ncbi:MAG: hypothetical protein ACRERR_05395 [Moraxellaceae bacterium]
MRRLTLPLLLATALLSACGGGGGSADKPVASSTPDETPVTVSGHFFSYVSDGSHIHAVDMVSGTVTEVAALATPTEDLKRIPLAFQRGLLNDRAIEWNDLLYVDNGKLYLLPARSDTATPPAPRQLSSASNINPFCSMQASVSADGNHEGLLFFAPDAGKGCYDGVGSSYLVTTDMTPGDAPISGPADWVKDIKVSYVSKGNYSITSFIGIRDGKLVKLNRSHQTSAILKTGIAHIDHAIRAAGVHPDLIFVSLTSSSGDSSHHLLNLASNTLFPDLGPAFSSPVFDTDKIYGLHSLPPLYANSTVYSAGLDGSSAQDIGCAPISNAFYILGKSGDLIVLGDGATRTALNLKTCEQKFLFNQSAGSYVLVQNDQAYFDDFSTQSFHRLNILTLEDDVTAQARSTGWILSPVTDGRTLPSSFILLSNLDKNDGDSLKLESYSLQGDRLVLGVLDSDIDAAEASFGNSSGHAMNTGIVSFSDTNEQEHYRLYSIKLDVAGSLTLLLEKDFLQQL